MIHRRGSRGHTTQFIRKRRARAVNGTTTTRYRWGLGWDLLNEENGGGTLTNMYIGHLAEVPGSNPATGAWGRENGGQSRLRSFVASLGTVPGFRSTPARVRPAQGPGRGVRVHALRRGVRGLWQRLDHPPLHRPRLGRHRRTLLRPVPVLRPEYRGMAKLVTFMFPRQTADACRNRR